MSGSAKRIPIDPETHAAMLGTNEINSGTLYVRSRAANRRAGRPANGYLVGVGVANALAAMSVFDTGVTPRGIVLIDVDPRVVVGGRVLIKLLQANTTFARLVAQCGDPDRIGALIDQVIAEEPARRIRARLAAVDIALLTQTLVDRQSTLKHPAEYRSSNVSMVHALRSRYRAFRECAREGRFVVLLGDLTDARLSGAIAALPHYAGSNNVVYLSNVVDVVWVHGGRRGVSRYQRAVAELAARGECRNTYLATTFNDEYHVKSYPVPPVILTRPARRGSHRRGDLVCQADAEADKLLGPFRAHPPLAVTVGSARDSVIRFPKGVGVAARQLRIIHDGRTGRWNAVAEHGTVRVRRPDGTVVSRRRVVVRDGDVVIIADDSERKVHLGVHVVNSVTFTNSLGLRVRIRTA